MDDLNRRMLEADRARARARQAALEQRQAQGEAATDGALLRRDGERFLLGDQPLRDGDPIEVCVAGVGWVRGRFRAGAPPELGVKLGHPTEGGVVGEGWLTLPEGAVCRPSG